MSSGASTPRDSNSIAYQCSNDQDSPSMAAIGGKDKRLGDGEMYSLSNIGGYKSVSMNFSDEVPQSDYSNNKNTVLNYMEEELQNEILKQLAEEKLGLTMGDDDEDDEDDDEDDFDLDEPSVQFTTSK